MKKIINVGKEFSFDFSALFADKTPNNVLDSDIQEYKDTTSRAFKSFEEIRNGKVLKHGEPALFTSLAYQGEEVILKIEKRADFIRSKFKNVVSLGIGGSYLGNKTLFDALTHRYHNFSEKVRKGLPALFFAGNNVDPESLIDLLDILLLKETHFVIISKSGGTVEPMSAFLYIVSLLKEQGLDLSEHITAITSKEKGTLFEICREHNIESLEVPYGIGGRWSVLSNVGLLTSAAVGIDIRKLLKGAAIMDDACKKENLEENPALLYAMLHYILYKKYGKNITVLMPYADGLASLADWYIQLLAESLGKKYDIDGDIVYEGRTPIPALGTRDMHAQTQQHREGSNIRVLTFIKIKRFNRDIIVPDVFSNHEKLGAMAGKKLSNFLIAALDANSISLSEAERPSMTITISEKNEITIGGLIFFFEMATAYEGELIKVNSYDQPGVEAYKKVMKDLLK